MDSVSMLVMFTEIEFASSSRLHMDIVSMLVMFTEIEQWVRFSLWHVIRMCLHEYTHTNCILGKIFLKVSDTSLFYFLTLLRRSNEYIISQKLKNSINTQTILFMRNWSSSKKLISFDELRIVKQSKDFDVLAV